MMGTNRSGGALTALLLAAAAPALAQDKPTAPSPSSPTQGVRVVLELSQQFYYAGDPFLVRIVAGNDGAKELKNPLKGPLYQGLRVSRSAGGALEATGKPDSVETTRPEKLAPNSFYGAVVDVAEVFPEIRTPGAYEVQFSADGVTSSRVTVRIIPKYDPTREYRARLETEQGAVVIDLLRDRSPLAVKAFVDMANAGFYDGLTFHEIRADWLIAGGDPAGDGSGAPPFRYPAELGSTPVVAGTVVMRPSGVAPPSNGSQFMILLRPEPTFTGQVTVLGQVVEGLDVVQKISRLPSSQQASKPYFKPLKDVRIQKVTISERVPSAPQG